MRLTKEIFTLSILSIMLAGCATKPESDPAYVSPMQYEDYNCKQISAEIKLVSEKIRQNQNADNTNQVLKTLTSAYAISQGVGYYGDENVALERLQNEYNLLERTSIKKQCNLK